MFDRTDAPEMLTLMFFSKYVDKPVTKTDIKKETVTAPAVTVYKTVERKATETKYVTKTESAKTTTTVITKANVTCKTDYSYHTLTIVAPHPTSTQKSSSASKTSSATHYPQSSASKHY